MANVFLAVARDDAKALFAARNPDALRSFVLSYEPSDEQRLEVSSEWMEANDYLQRIGQQNDQIAMPLTMAFNGGRPLLQEGSQQVYLVRPDIVGYLGAILSGLNLEELSEDSQLKTDIIRLQEFYTQAAESRQCVIFTIGIL